MRNEYSVPTSGRVGRTLEKINSLHGFGTITDIRYNLDTGIGTVERDVQSINESHDRFQILKDDVVRFMGRQVRMPIVHVFTPEEYLQLKEAAQTCETCNEILKQTNITGLAYLSQTMIAHIGGTNEVKSRNA